MTVVRCGAAIVTVSSNWGAANACRPAHGRGAFCTGSHGRSRAESDPSQRAARSGGRRGARGCGAAVVFGGWKLGLAARAAPRAAALVIAVGSALAFGPALAWRRSGPAESVARGPFGARSPCPPEARIGLGPT